VQRFKEGKSQVKWFKLFWREGTAAQLVPEKGCPEKKHKKELGVPRQAQGARQVIGVA